METNLTITNSHYSLKKADGKIAGNQRYFEGRFVSIFPYVGFHAHEIRQASRLQSIFCGKARFHFLRTVCFQFGQTSRLLQEAFPSGKASLYFAGFSLSFIFLFWRIPWNPLNFPPVVISCQALRKILAVSFKFVKLPAYYKTLMLLGMQVSSWRDCLPSFVCFAFFSFFPFFSSIYLNTRSLC